MKLLPKAELTARLGVSQRAVERWLDENMTPRKGELARITYAIDSLLVKKMRLLGINSVDNIANLTIFLTGLVTYKSSLERTIQYIVNQYG